MNPTLSTALPDGIATNASAAAEGLAAVTAKNAAPLATNLTALSGLLVDFASGFRDPIKPPPQPLQLTPETVRSSFEDSAFDIFVAALALQEAAGIKPTGDVAFSLAGSSHCGCKAAAEPVKLPLAVEPVKVQPLPVKLPDAPVAVTTLPAAVESIEALSAKMADPFDNAGRFTDQVIAYFDEYWYVACSDDCTGPNGAHVRKSITRYSGVTAGLGAFQPMFDVQWEYCCQKWCLFETESWVKTITTTNNAGGVVNTQQQAIAAAKARAPAIFAKLPWPASPC